MHYLGVPFGFHAEQFEKITDLQTLFSGI